MRDIKTTLYKFEELSEEAKATACRDYREDGVHIDAEIINEIFKEKLESLGLPNDNVNWSLSYCQGDGVAFYGQVDLEKYLQKEYLQEFKDLPIEEMQVEISRCCSHHYHHQNSMMVELFFESEETQATVKLANKLEDQIKAQVKAISQDFEKLGYKIIEEQSSDEYIGETLLADCYEFYEDGALFHAEEYFVKM